MATIAKTLTPSLSSVEPPQNDTVPGLLAGEAIAPGDCCYVKSDGTVWRTNGTAATAPALYCGIYLGSSNVAVGEGLTLFANVTVRYSAGLTPGTRYFVSATAGAIDDAATTGGTVAVAYAVDATQIHFFPVGR
jgi:hypothetical protein